MIGPAMNHETWNELVDNVVSVTRSYPEARDAYHDKFDELIKLVKYDNDFCDKLGDDDRWRERFSPSLLKSRVHARWIVRQLMQDSPPRAVSVVRPPGSGLMRILPYLFSKKTIEYVFLQGIADMREEYFAALAVKTPWLARATYVRWCIGVVATVASHWGVSLAKKVHQIWKLTSGG